MILICLEVVLDNAVYLYKANKLFNGYMYIQHFNLWRNGSFNAYLEDLAPYKHLSNTPLIPDIYATVISDLFIDTGIL